MAKAVEKNEEVMSAADRAVDPGPAARPSGFTMSRRRGSLST